MSQKDWNRVVNFYSAVIILVGGLTVFVSLVVMGD